jgi:hypothetical protein
MRDVDQYVVLEWLDELPGYPRYSFATVKHAEELSADVQWLQLCPSLETAATTASELNLRLAISVKSGSAAPLTTDD